HYYQMTEIHLEVVRIHMKLLGVQLAQLSISVLDVVHVLQFTKLGEVPLGPGVHDEAPGYSMDHIHTSTLPKDALFLGMDAFWRESHLLKDEECFPAKINPSGKHCLLSFKCGCFI
uniref:Uncharacterized protein n=1 Tax=Scleropages formosus TaxID=113540 RepID=A0A8C9S9R9_SCLFO